MRRGILLSWLLCACGDPFQTEFEHQRIDAYVRAMAAKDGHVYGVTNVGEVLIREDGAWQSSGQLALTLYTVWVNSTEDVWVGGTDGHIHRGDGVRWARVLPAESGLSATDNVDALFGTPGSTGGTGRDVWALTPERGIAHEKGSPWPGSWPVRGAIFRAGWAASSTDMWVVGDQPGPGLLQVGVIVHWDGTTWSEQSCEGCQGVLRAVWGLNNHDVWAAGDRLAHFDGTAWTTVPLPMEATVTALWSDAHDDLWVGIDRKPGVLHWNGQTWSEVGTPFFGATALTGDAKKVWFASTHRIFSVDR